MLEWQRVFPDESTSTLRGVSLSMHVLVCFSQMDMADSERHAERTGGPRTASAQTCGQNPRLSSGFLSLWLCGHKRVTYPSDDPSDLLDVTPEETPCSLESLSLPTCSSLQTLGCLVWGGHWPLWKLWVSSWTAALDRGFPSGWQHKPRYPVGAITHV